MSNNNVLITVIIVTYNAEKYIGRALESLVSRINDQTEVLIIDGLSKDNTLGIVNVYEPYITKVLSEKDSGIYDAMNKGVSIANGKFILFLGADDELLLNLNDLISVLIDEDTIYYGDVIVTPSNKLYGGEFNVEKLLNRNICHQSIFYPSKIFKEFKFDLDYRLMADYVLNMRLWASKRYRFKYFPKSISKYSLQGESSTTIDVAFKRDSFKIVYNLFGVYGVIVKCMNPFRKYLIK